MTLSNLVLLTVQIDQQVFFYKLISFSFWHNFWTTSIHILICIISFYTYLKVKIVASFLHNYRINYPTSSSGTIFIHTWCIHFSKVYFYFFTLSLNWPSFSRSCIRMNEYLDLISISWWIFGQVRVTFGGALYAFTSTRWYAARNMQNRLSRRLGCSQNMDNTYLRRSR